MALKMRLARRGTKKRPFYHIVVADGREPRDGRYIEKVGSYNPLLPREHDNRVQLDNEKIQQWLKNGAQPTERVSIFLGQSGLIEMPKTSERPQKSKPKAKAQERIREAEEKAQAEAEAASAAAEEEASAAQTETTEEAEPQAGSSEPQAPEEPAAEEPAAEEPAAEKPASEEKADEEQTPEEQAGEEESKS